MKKSFAAWPEVVFIDGTYNLLKRKLVVLLICDQDANNFTQIIGVGLLANEEANTLKSLFYSFKKLNQDACQRIKCFMTDKDLTERSVLKEVFPEIALYICEFHVLKVFSRAITMAAMKITSQQRDTALDLLDKLTKSNSEEQYDYYYEKFCKTTPKTVVSYFNKNWHIIRNEWVRYSLSKNNFGNYTNNPVESTNARLKDEIPPHSTIMEFCHGFFRYLNRRNEFIKFKLGQDIYKHPLRGYNKETPEYMYQESLTTVAFNKVIVQFTRRKPMTFLEVSKSLQICWIQ